ncbi:MAG TPA: metal-dependent transcriptional regulator [Chloroflexota bacterium]
MATPTIEEYLETIYILETENPPVRAGRVAESMGVSAPTMTDTLKRLVQQGFATVGGGKSISLTAAGREAAEAMVRRHRLWERWLVDVLGMDWSAVHEEACRLEHALSPEVEARLTALLGNPSTCPHGNPIPGLSREPLQAARLSEVLAGDEVVLARVTPAGEKDPRLLDYLKQVGLLPGTQLRVLEVAPWSGLVTVGIDGRTAVIGIEVAEQLHVTASRR